jgi:hypothetical protein
MRNGKKAASAKEIEIGVQKKLQHATENAQVKVALTLLTSKSTKKSLCKAFYVIVIYKIMMLFIFSYRIGFF